MTSRLSFMAVSAFLFFVSSTFAHRPYEHQSGTFERADGMTLLIFKHYVDGIVVNDPVSIQFRLPDGKEVARTEHVADAVIRRSSPHQIEIYEFEQTFFPWVARIRLFDGYTLSDATSASAWWTALTAHLDSHWRGYLIAVGFAVFLIVALAALQRLPARGGIAFFRGLGILLVTMAGLLYLVILTQGPISPLILAAFGYYVPVSFYHFIRNCSRPAIAA